MKCTLFVAGFCSIFYEIRASDYLNVAIFRAIETTVPLANLIYKVFDHTTPIHYQMFIIIIITVNMK